MTNILFFVFSFQRDPGQVLWHRQHLRGGSARRDDRGLWHRHLQRVGPPLCHFYLLRLLCKESLPAEFKRKTPETRLTLRFLTEAVKWSDCWVSLDTAFLLWFKTVGEFAWESGKYLSRYGTPLTGKKWEIHQTKVEKWWIYTKEHQLPRTVCKKGNIGVGDSFGLALPIEKR